MLACFMFASGPRKAFSQDAQCIALIVGCPPLHAILLQTRCSMFLVSASEDPRHPHEQRYRPQLFQRCKRSVSIPITRTTGLVECVHCINSLSMTAFGT